MGTILAQNYSADSIPEELKQNSDAVVRSNELIVTISSLTKLEVQTKRVVTVLNENGNADIGAYAYYSTDRKIKSINAKIFDATGKEIKRYGKKDFNDVSAVDGGSLYTDSRVLHLAYFPTSYPFTVEFYSEYTTKDTGAVPSFMFMEGYRCAIERSNYTLNFNDDSLKPLIKEKNFEGYNIIKREKSNQFFYEIASVPSVREEEMMPTIYKVWPRLIVAPLNFTYGGNQWKINNWRDFGLNMDKNMLKGRDELSPETKTKVKQLVKGVEDDLEKAKIIFNYVQKNTRYISVQVGVGGIQPIAAEQVDMVKYGDCKGLSNYTKALLDVAGVKSYYVHVEAGTEKIDFDEDLPSLAEGNHVILALPYKGEYYWLDSTSQVVPFGYIANFTDDRRVLVITENGGELIRTPAYLNQTNYQYTNANYSLHKNGTIDAIVNIETKGSQYGRHYYLEQEDELDIEKHYKYFWSYLNNLHLKKVNFKNDKENIIFKEQINLIAEKYASLVDGKLVFAPNAFNKSEYIPPRIRNRKYAIQIERGYFDEDEYDVQLPEGVVVDYVPEPIIHNTQFGTYTLQITQKQNGIHLKRSMLLKAGTYPKEDYDAIRNFFRSIKKADNQKVIVILNTKP